MNSFLHGLGGGLGRGIGRFIAILIIAFLLYFVINLLDLDIKNDFINRVLMLNVSAKQQTSTVTSDLYTDMGGDCTGGQRGYCILQTNGIAYTRQMNTTYNGVLNAISFDLHYVMNPSYQYTLNLYAMSSDFRNNNLSLYVCGYNSNNYSNCTTISASLRFISKSQLQIIFPVQTYETYHVDIIGSPLTGVSTYGIKSAVLVYDDNSTDMSGVIDSQNQNTSDIINNNNSNTEQVVNTINNFFGNNCKNIFITSNYSTNQFSTININDDSVTVTASQTWRILSYSFDVTSGSSYKFYYSSDSTGAIVYYSLNNSTWTQVQNMNYTTITPSSNKIYFRFQNSSLGIGSYTFKNIMLYQGSDNLPYCSPGSSSSKLDDLNKNQQETNDLIKDDTIDQGQANSFFTGFESDDHGLSGIITLPLTTIQSLTSKQCVALELPIPFTDGSVSLPCMSEIYQSKAPALYSMWQVVCYGLIGYWIGTDIFKMVKGLKDPEDDKIEVVDL